MLLQALVEYYDMLAKFEDSDIAMTGYSDSKISYAILLSREGKIKGVRLLKHLDSKGKKLIPVNMKVPEQIKRANSVVPYFLCDNSTYILGVDNKRTLEKSRSYFEAYKLHNLKYLETINTEEIIAYKRYLNSWNPEQAREHPILSEYIDDITAGAFLIFQVEGYNHYIHQAPEVMKEWERINSDTSNKIIRTCMVTGKQRPIAIIHPGIKGIRGGQPMGNTLISYNASAYESYGNSKAQGLNAPVSESAAFAYGTVLNYLLADKRHCMTLGDSTVVYWAQSPQSRELQDMFMFLNSPDIESRQDDLQEYIVNEGAIRNIKAILEKIAKGQSINNDVIFEENVKFYILALSPNAARISIRFFLANNFGDMMQKLINHYKDMAIEKQFDSDPNAISVWRILNETVAPTSKDKTAIPLLTGAVLKAIWQETSYPVALYQAILIRLRVDKEVTYVKAAVVKAYLLRCSKKQQYKKEGVLGMSLNKESKNKAYVLGRLFAVLEWTQMGANPGINSTIKDRYFTSACATPAVTFPVLLRLSNHHISKAEYGKSDEKRISEIMQLLDVEDTPFPTRLALDEQGIFILGYYHQKNDLFRVVREKSEANKN